MNELLQQLAEDGTEVISESLGATLLHTRGELALRGAS
jgi:hypothetical protein